MKQGLPTSHNFLSDAKSGTLAQHHQVFGVWFLIFLVWSFYRAYAKMPEWFDELIVKPAVFVVPVLYILFRERKNILELGFKTGLREIIGDLYIGVVVGIIFALEGLAANYFKYGRFVFIPITAVAASGGVVPFLIINVATSLWEEILGRGYLYQKLIQASRNQLWAAVSSSFLFLLLHVPIMFTKSNLTGKSFIIYPLSILFLGITNCYLFTLRKSLTLPILLHTFWNMTVALYL